MKKLLFLILMLCAILPARAAETPDAAMHTRPRFAWGAETGGSVDLSGNDMSSFDFNLSFGIRYRWLKFAGIGTGADIMVSNSCRTFPVYVRIATDFHTLPQLLFLDLKGGIGFNYLENNRQSTGAYAYSGLGINFARTAKFSSYMSIGYSFIQHRDNTDAIVTHSDLHMATIKIGINF